MTIRPPNALDLLIGSPSSYSSGCSVGSPISFDQDMYAPKPVNGPPSPQLPLEIVQTIEDLQNDKQFNTPINKPKKSAFFSALQCPLIPTQGRSNALCPNCPIHSSPKFKNSLLCLFYRKAFPCKTPSMVILCSFNDILGHFQLSSFSLVYFCVYSNPTQYLRCINLNLNNSANLHSPSSNVTYSLYFSMKIHCLIS